jgi:hypothetical protein
MTDMMEEKRASDHGLWCTVALRFSQFWDFVDKRDIDKHTAAFGIIFFMLDRTVRIVVWGRQLAIDWMEAAKSGHAIPGTDVAAVIVAIAGPWSIALSAVLGTTLAFYFRARQ